LFRQGSTIRTFDGKTLGLKAVLFAAILFFGTLGEGLALDFGRLTQAFGAVTSAFFGGS
jgi:hypothetical protein